MLVKLNTLYNAMKYAWQGVAPGDFVSSFRLVRFEEFTDKLQLRTFNGTLGVQTYLPISEQDEELSEPIVVDADRLMRYLQGFDAADTRDVLITREKAKLTFQFKRAGKLSLAAAQLKTAFWSPPDLKTVDWCLHMDSKFRSASKLLLSIAGLDTARLVTQGIFLDSNTMHVTSGAAIGEFTEKGKFKQPLALVYDFVGMLVGQDADLELGVTKNMVVVRGDDVIFVQPIFRCPAPDFGTMLQDFRKPKARIAVNLKLFVERFKRIGNMTDQSNRGIKLIFKDGVLKFGFEDGEVLVRESIKYQGTYEGEVTLNFAYIKGYLDELTGRSLKQLELGFHAADKGVVFKIAEPFILVLLPMVAI